MKKYFIPFILTFMLILIPKNTYAQSITPTTIRVKSSDNSQVLADQSLDFFTNSPYYSTQIELPFSSPTLQYNTSYGIDMYVDFYVSYYNDWGNFGLNSPGIYISYNGLHGQSFNYNSFNNNLQNVSNVVGWYRLHLSGTFATNSQGTLYIALPFSHAIDLYGAKFVSADLNYYGSNTSNSDIIANNNQNTQNIITNNNNNTQQIINSNNQINNNITDTDTSGAESESVQFFDNFFQNNAEPNALMDLLRLPITFLQSLNNQCSPITLTIPYFDTITIPCIQSYLSTFLPTALLDLIRLIVNGILGYHLLMSLVKFISDIKDPNNDELEVVDL